MRVPLGVRGGGVWGRVQGGGGGWFLVESEGNGKGVGREGCGVGTGKGTGKSMRKLCRNYPLAIYPLVSPRLLHAMGFLVSQHGELGAIPPPPFLSVSPLESMRNGGAIHPPQKGYLSDTCAIPHENKAKHLRYPPLRDGETTVKKNRFLRGGASGAESQIAQNAVFSWEAPRQ